MNRFLNHLETSASRFNNLVDANLQAPLARALTLNVFDTEAPRDQQHAAAPWSPRGHTRLTIAILGVLQRLLQGAG